MARTYGFGFLPDLTRGRRQVNRLTGQSYVPVLELDDGTTIAGSEQIAAWARAHSAETSGAPIEQGQFTPPQPG